MKPTEPMTRLPRHRGSPTPQQTQAPSLGAGPSRRLTALLAITSGMAVANLYYVQPLLDTIARALSVHEATAGLLVTGTQIGYVVGLSLLVPLGDLLERRRLVTSLLVLAAVGLIVIAAAPSFTIIAGALVAVGAFSVVAQIVVALAADLATDAERGRVVGSVMSGLLMGILSARTLSGLLAAAMGWRATFALAAGVMLALALVLMRALPCCPPTRATSYARTLGSIVTLIVHQPILRQRMVLGALGFAGFSTLWTSIAFLLAGHHYHFSEAIIGLFGLAGAAGAAVAPFAGKLADRGHGKSGTVGFLLCILASWALLATGKTSLPALIVGIVVLDLGVQGAQISHQSAIYALDPDARSRLTTAYMVAVFSGGILGSTLSAMLYGIDGWTGVCVLGAAMGAAAVLVGATTIKRDGSGLEPALGIGGRTRRFGRRKCESMQVLGRETATDTEQR